MNFTRVRLLAIGAIINAVATQAQAEGSYQFGLNQPYQDFTQNGSKAIYVDVLTAGEVINFAFCGSGYGSLNDTGTGDSITINVYSPGADPNSASPLATNTATGNINCDDPLNAPLDPANLLQFDTSSHGTGSFVVTIENNQNQDIDRLDISVTPDAATFPDPTVAAGRLWAYNWTFFTGTFNETEATDADYYALVPGGRPNTHYVWKLDLNNFSGNYYALIANDLGVDAPYSGYSVPLAGNTIAEKFPLYIGYPATALDRPTNPPVLSDFRFVDNAGQDYAISPSTSSGVQDSGVFTFTSDVAGTYAITIDINSDGVYGANDRLLLGNMVVGNNSVSWDGTGTDGVTALAPGQYRAKIQARLGEYHFVAGDAETSGGTEAGLTIFLANSNGSTTDTTVYWDDETFLSGTSNLPGGASSGTPAGRHTWGDFTEVNSIGDQTFVDTYVYGASSTYSVITAITADDSLQTGATGSINADATTNLSGSFAITVTDSDNNVLSNSVESVTATVTNGSTGEVEQITLTETAANSGVFSASLIVADVAGKGTDNDASMNVQAGDLLTSSYQDQLDNVGGTQNVTATTSVNSGTPSASTSTITATPNAIVADGRSTSAITVQLKDINGNNLSSSGGTVTLSTNNGSLSNIIDQGDGSYSATLTSSLSPGTASISGSINGTNITDTAEVTFTATQVGDSDGDGIDDSTDLDSDNDGIPDAAEGNGDSDGDSVPDYLDLDSDNDGLYDLVEAGVSELIAPTTLDANSDGRIDNGFGSNGLADAIETSADSGAIAYTLWDNDSDGVEDFRDLDSDNDSLSDVVEAGGNDADNDGVLGSGIPTVDAAGLPNGAPLTAVDTDNDGELDQVDVDADNDGVFDIIEVGGTDNDNDGRLDNFTDSNDDGWDDGAAGSGTVPVDTDNDGIPDYKDADDTDSDGIYDALDLDDDNDGISDMDEGSDAVDSDGDGIPDSRDLDSDNDGLFDLVESGLSNYATLDTDNDGMIDGNYGSNGLADAVETSADSGTTSYNLADSDNDGVADFRDLDSDNDGVSDLAEAGATDPDFDGVIGSGVPAVNALGQPNGGPLLVLDSDNDGSPNQRDLDSDNDGINDIIEFGLTDQNDDGTVDGFSDSNGDGRDDATATSQLPTVDSDNDGVPDFMDADDVDGDGIFDATDLDDDNDGIPDTDEGDGSVDTDGDGVPDSRDLDSDNDGLFDLSEAGLAPLQTLASLDADSNGQLDGTVGNNGLIDSLETSPDSGVLNYDLADTDGDQLADFRDLDSDGDGVFDVQENGSSDPDNNGLIGTGNTPAVNALGIAAGTSGTAADTNNDGLADFQDENISGIGSPTNPVEPEENVIKTGREGVGGCSAVTRAPFDPTLPGIFLLALTYMARRRLRSTVIGDKKNETL